MFGEGGGECVGEAAEDCQERAGICSIDVEAEAEVAVGVEGCVLFSSRMIVETDLFVDKEPLGSKERVDVRVVPSSPPDVNAIVEMCRTEPSLSMSEVSGAFIIEVVIPNAGGSTDRSEERLLGRGDQPLSSTNGEVGEGRGEGEGAGHTSSSFAPPLFAGEMLIFCLSSFLSMRTLSEEEAEVDTPSDESANVTSSPCPDSFNEAVSCFADASLLTGVEGSLCSE